MAREEEEEFITSGDWREKHNSLSRDAGADQPSDPPPAIKRAVAKGPRGRVAPVLLSLPYGLRGRLLAAVGGHICGRCADDADEEEEEDEEDDVPVVQDEESDEM